MNPRWKKLGLLYSPSRTGRHPKLLTHAANPLPVLLEGDIYRIYYSGRDIDNRSSVGAVDINIVTRQVVQEHHAPIFEHGHEGSFFADGVSIGNCYCVDGVQYMLFMGWQNPAEGHWRGDIGRLIVNPDLTLELESQAPFMGSDRADPISLSYPWVMQTADGDYRMWYGSTASWDAGNGEMLHTLNHATSDDGHRWNRLGLAVPYIIGEAQAFSRPTVVGSMESGFEMWFSYRSGTGTSYRIGYARSNDGCVWRLCLSTVGIEVSENDWDSEMIEYPFVFIHNNQRYMLYNGNGYGKSGFGLAVLVDA
ncbi:hypothetical protein IMF27_10950 [Pseudomonas sp. PCH199]|uniref:hypothetical protein n=1 Tax=unclassified Pseudomonas TaxID=196821 RepID=UPI000BD67291|nr:MULTISPECIES: hypothetical protein [unclassified Pseudomonas]MCW8276144.1 hypothetical protein [Pseudomonas sp. PCH199]PAM83534.1 hypothetical protein CES87_11215 [Pseudomonas sp. ERMR1:02]